MTITSSRDGQQVEFTVQSEAGTHYYRTNRQGYGLWFSSNGDDWHQMVGTDGFSALGSMKAAQRKLAVRLGQI